MAIATTAQLIVEIIGKDALSPAVGSAERSLSTLSGTSTTASKAVGLVENAATGMGNALNHAKGFLGGLISGPLGLLGLGAGALTAAGAIKETIGTANDLAKAIEVLAPLTGDTAEQVSGLIAVFNKFGIDTSTATARLAFMEKAVGNLTLTTAKATAFQKEFGVSLVDASGHVKDANTLIALAADYWNGSASASEKAAFEAKLFGRGFADMIPILNLGSAGIRDAEAAAAQLGLTLNATNVKDLQAYQAQMRETGDVIGGLKLQIALTLIPTLTQLAKGFSQFVTDHRTDIVTFFKNAIVFAKQVGGALASVGSGLAGLWAKIPGPLQTLLLQALVGNKIIKTVFGIDIVGTVEGAVANMGKDILGKLVGSIFGKNIATPVVNIEAGVANVGGVGGAVAGAAGGAEEVAGGAAATAGGIGVAATAALLALPAALLGFIGWIQANAPQKGPASPLPIGAGRASTIGSLPLNHEVTVPIVGALARGAATTETALGKAADDISMVTNRASDRAMSIGQRIAAAAQGIFHEAQLHGAAIEKIKDIAGSNHDFLTLFRTGSAKTAVKFFPAEYNYLATASAQTKATAQYVSGLKQDISTLQKAEVGATAAQKATLNSDILKLQALVAATTAAVYKVGLSPVALGKLQDIKDKSQSTTSTTTHRSNTIAAKKANGYGPTGNAV